jgi:hypothetical protein
MVFRGKSCERDQLAFARHQAAALVSTCR